MKLQELATEIYKAATGEYPPEESYELDLGRLMLIPEQVEPDRAPPPSQEQSYPAAAPLPLP